MGQPVTVVKKDSGRDGLISFELNRSITGMGHESYSSAPVELIEPELDGNVADDLARELFEHLGEGLNRVHINSNIVTLELTGADARGAEIQTLLENMFLHYEKRIPDSE